MYNSVTNTLVGTSGGQSGTTYAFPVNSANAGNTLVANVFVIDTSANQVTVNSIKSGVFTVFTSLNTPTIAPSSNANYDQGTSIIFTASASGGTGSYTYNFLVYNSVTNTLVGMSGGQAGTTYAFPVNSANAGNTLVANVFVTDTSGNAIAANSIYSGTFTVYSALGIPMLTSNPTLPASWAVGNTITYTASWSGGVSSYTVNFLVVNTITGSLAANYLTTNTFTSNSFTWLIPLADIGNTLQANVIITDSAANVETTNSVPSGTLTVISSYTPPAVTISAPSNSLVDVGQYETFTATEAGGSTTSFTYNFLVVNSVTLGTIAHNALFQSVSSTTSTFTYQVISSDVANSPEKANVVLTDTNPTTVNSVYTSTFTISPAPTVSITPSSNANYDQGTSIIFTASASGGTGSYTYNFLVYNSVTNTLVGMSGGQAGTTYAFPVNSANAGNTLVANVFVTDSATTHVTVNSILSGIFTVEPTLGTPTITPSSNANYDQGTSIIFTASASGGTGSYTYNFFVYNSVTNTLVGTSGGQSGTTYAFPVNSANAGNTLVANVFVIDTSANQVTVNSIKSGVFTVFTSLNTPTIAPSSNANYDQGTSIIFTASASGGTGSYTYNFLVYNSVTNTLVGMSGGQAGTTYAFPVNSANAGNTLVANVFVIDTSANQVTVNSIKSGVFTVFTSLNTPTITPSSNANYDQGTCIIFTASASGGTGSYTYNFFVYNSVTNTLVGTSGGQSGTTYAFPVNSANAGNTLVANVFVIDTSANQVTVNSIKSGVFTVFTSLNTPTITPSSNANYDQGTSIIFTASASGGTGSYTYNFFVYNSVTNTLVGTSGGQSGTTYAFPVNSANAGNTLVANVFVIDTSANQVTVNSIKSGVFTVKPTLGTPTITPSSNANYDQGTSIIFTASASGGTGSYTYNFFVYNSVTNTLVGTSGGQSGTTYAFPVNSANAGNTLVANVFVIDTSANQVTVNSITLRSLHRDTYAWYPDHNPIL